MLWLKWYKGSPEWIIQFYWFCSRLRKNDYISDFLQPSNKAQNRGGNVRLSLQPPDPHGHGALLQGVVWVAYSDSVGPHRGNIAQNEMVSPWANHHLVQKGGSKHLFWAFPILSVFLVPIILLLWSEVVALPVSFILLGTQRPRQVPCVLSFSKSLNRGPRVHHVK